MIEISDLKREIHATLKLVSTQKYISMIRKAFDIKFENKNEHMLYFKNKNIKNYERIAVRIFELWKDIDKTGESYFFTIDPAKKTITFVKDCKLEIVDMYTPRGIKIFMKYFFINTSSIVYYYGVTLPDELKNEIEFIYYYDKNKQEEIINDLVERLNKKIEESADIYDEKMKNYEENKEWFAKRGNFLDIKDN